MTPLPPESLRELRSSCEASWRSLTPEFDSERFEERQIKGGPADGATVLWRIGEKDWQGPWYQDDGQMVLLYYEITEEGHGEYAGARLMTELASEVAEGEFASSRGAPEPELVDVDKMTTTEALAFLLEDNDRRTEELLENSGGAVDISEMFDGLFIRTFVDHLLRYTSTKAYEAARLEFENKRSLRIDLICDKYEAAAAERKKQMTQATLAGQAIPPQFRQGAEVQMPNRRIRRANGGG